MGANTPMTKETQKFIKEINKMNELERAVQQYNAVVQQNKDLQRELIHSKEIITNILTYLLGEYVVVKPNKENEKLQVIINKIIKIVEEGNDVS
ncbi:MAG: hypothetical protein IJ681_00600 [Bacteroidales bacterium]|nr:hypothetical protein [Bacteroidales bacterium]